MHEVCESGGIGIEGGGEVDAFEEFGEVVAARAEGKVVVEVDDRDGFVVGRPACGDEVESVVRALIEEGVLDASGRVG